MKSTIGSGASLTTKDRPQRHNGLKSAKILPILWNITKNLFTYILCVYEVIQKRNTKLPLTLFLFFCTVMIQIGSLYMYKDLLFFASSALLWYLFCWNHPSLDLKVQILFLKPRSLLLPKNTNPSPSVDAWNRITSALINKSGKLSRRRKKSRTHTDRCILVSCSTSLKKS